MATALSTIREYVGVAFCRHDEFKSLIPDAANGDTDTISCDDTATIYDNDHFNDWWGRWTASTDAGTNFRVTDFTSSSGKLDFLPAVSNAPVAADTFQLMFGVHPDELDTAINYAIQATENIALEPVKNETLTVIASTWEYSVPASIEYIEAIIQEGGTSGEYHGYNAINHRGWDIISDGTTPKIRFDQGYCTLTTGRKLRIIGQSKPSTLSAETDTTEIFVPYLVQVAIMYLCEQRADEPRYEAKWLLAKARAEEMIPDVTVAPIGKRVHW